jgi:hypothetical protein
MTTAQVLHIRVAGPAHAPTRANESSSSFSMAADSRLPRVDGRRHLQREAKREATPNTWQSRRTPAKRGPMYLLARRGIPLRQLWERRHVAPVTWNAAGGVGIAAGLACIDSRPGDGMTPW